MKREQETFPYIAHLLNGAEVEWKPLGEVAKVNKGVQLNKTKLKDEGKYPAYNGGKTYSGWTDDFNVEENTTIISQGGASAGFVNFVTTKFWANAHCYYIIPNLEIVNNRYLYQFLKFQEKFFMNSQHGAGIPALAISKLNKHLIPVPPLSVQEEIVRILDKFTQLEAELEAELDCRKQQYEYYRDKLLTSDENQVEWKTLGKVGAFVRGKGLQKKDLIASGVPAIHYGQIYTYYGVYAYKTKSFVSEDFAQKARKAQCGDLVIATTSENDEDVCKAVAWLGDEKVVVSSDACFYTHTMNPKYVAYYFQTEHFQKQKKVFITGTKVRRVNADDLAKITIPIPPIEEQERIAGILDKFDTLVNSISEGLPREIELRRKQYEYYREKLLSFPTE